MVDKHHHGSTAPGILVRPILICLCTLILASGCGSLFVTTIRVEEDAVDEVRSIGRIVAETTQDPIYRDTVQIDNILILDVGAPSFKRGVSIAESRLEKHGWEVDSKIPAFTDMKSTRWKDTSLTVRPYKKDDSYKYAIQNQIADKVNVEPNEQNKYLLVIVTATS